MKRWFRGWARACEGENGARVRRRCDSAPAPKKKTGAACAYTHATAGCDQRKLSDAGGRGKGLEAKIVGADGGATHKPRREKDAISISALLLLLAPASAADVRERETENTPELGGKNRKHAVASSTLAQASLALVVRRVG